MSDGGRLQLDLDLQDVAATAFDGNGVVLASSSAPCETLCLQPGWAEQRPADWWEGSAKAVAALGLDASLSAIERVTLGGDLRGAVLLDGEMEVIRPAILSGDIRMAGGIGSLVQWLRGNQTIAFKRLQHLLTPRSYLRFLLTGQLMIDEDDASSTGLFDVAAGGWSGVLCESAEVNVELLPGISDGRQFEVADEIAVQLRLA